MSILFGINFIDFIAEILAITMSKRKWPWSLIKSMYVRIAEQDWDLPRSCCRSFQFLHPCSYCNIPQLVADARFASGFDENSILNIKIGHLNAVLDVCTIWVVGVDVAVDAVTHSVHSAAAGQAKRITIRIRFTLPSPGSHNAGALRTGNSWGLLRFWSGIGWLGWGRIGLGWKWGTCTAGPTNKQANKQAAGKQAASWLQDICAKRQNNWIELTTTDHQTCDLECGIWDVGGVVLVWCDIGGAAAWGPLTRPVMVLIALSMPQRSPARICVQAWFHRWPICSRIFGAHCTRQKKGLKQD